MKSTEIIYILNNMDKEELVEVTSPELGEVAKGPARAVINWICDLVGSFPYELSFEFYTKDEA